MNSRELTMAMATAFEIFEKYWSNNDSQKRERDIR